MNYFFEKESSQLLEVHKIPDDNSCLFRALAYLCESDGSDSRVTELRQTVGVTVLSNPDRWNEAMIGMPAQKYFEYICKPNTWGGSIELNILSEIFEIQITAIEIKNVKPYTFGQDKNYSQRVFLIYDGIHYDAVHDKTSVGGIQRKFDVFDQGAFQQAVSLAKQAKESGKFTDVYTFKLKCLDCGAILVGQNSAQEHATKTRHGNFTQV